MNEALEFTLSTVRRMLMVDACIQEMSIERLVHYNHVGLYLHTSKIY